MLAWKLLNVCTSTKSQLEFAVAGTASFMVVMNSSYTFSSYYDTNIPRHAFGDNGEGKIQLLEPATVRATGPAHHYFPATMDLLCPSSDIQDIVTPEDEDKFPVLTPNQALFRPEDSCVWRVSMPGSGASRHHQHHADACPASQ